MESFCEVVPKKIFKQKNSQKGTTTGKAKNSNSKVKWLRKRKRERKKQKRRANSEGPSLAKENGTLVEVPMYPLSNDPISVAERHRLKKEKRCNRTDSDDVKAQRALEYLEMWQNDRSSWKYKKNLDIFLVKYCLSKHRIPKLYFPILLEYFNTAKGNTLNNIRSSAEKILAAGREEDGNDSKTTRRRAKKIVKYFKDKC